ncbi:MAG: deoxyribodipyrimidine photo-lyase [Alphaproteobacteria bacterium]|nr:deoxyribodipyrimidine photo-lyase [Alphaproteobacteria bacterium]
MAPAMPIFEEEIVADDPPPQGEQASEELARDFRDRKDLETYLHALFDDVVGSHADRPHQETLSPFPGGRAEAIDRLAAVKPAQYKRTRNHLDGAVSRLSPYIRHGILSLSEARDDVLERSSPATAEKFVNELAWRDYWQRVYAKIGHGVWEDREEYKTGFVAADYADTLPPALVAGETGLACMDGFARELEETGYLHNHARMWVAAYVVHFLRVKWQAGARWFLAHLLDGDPASNNLSWQWVASTFSRKPYIWNRENLDRNTDGRYCAACPARDRCPLDKSYEALTDELFPNRPVEERT